MTPSPRVDADARQCARITRRHARTFALASWLLPPAKRRAAYAVYAFCRLADDIVDEGGDATGTGDEGTRAAAGVRLARYAAQLDAALAGRPEGPVFRELARAAEEYAIPAAVLHELLDGVARDLAWRPYATWDELVTYCEGVASSVGEMCAHVFGVGDGVGDGVREGVGEGAGGDPATRARAMRYARTLGVAMQLTNILRDVGEDARRGRCYLPEADLAAFGLSTADVLGDPSLGRDERWRPFMAYQIGRARSLYEAAAPGIALLAPDARRCATACALGYAAFLDAIAAAAYDSVSARACVGRAARLRVLWSSWRGADAALPPARDARGPHVAWARPAASGTTPPADLVRLA
jgi:15-cis-phytoene synthase